MDARLLDYYNRELRHLRQLAGEFAAAHPKIAGRLGLDSVECSDPYVERLLEGFSFMAARIQLKQESQYPQFCQQLLEMLYPQLLAPTPACAIVQMQPDYFNPQLLKGITVPRHSTLLSQPGAQSDTRCQFMTSNELTLWPLQLSALSYQAWSPLTSPAPAQTCGTAQARLTLHFRVCGGAPAHQLPLARLPLYLQGNDALSGRLYQHLLNQQCAATLSWQDGSSQQCQPLPPLHACGWQAGQRLLPDTLTGFDGFQLLQEFFAFRSRFLFVEQTGLASVLTAVNSSEFELHWYLKHFDPLLANSLHPERLLLYCSPAINLFRHRSARISLDPRHFDYPLLVDPLHPLDFEIHRVAGVRYYDSAHQVRTELQPVTQVMAPGHSATGYYQLRRSPRQLAQGHGQRSRYLGSETRIAVSLPAALAGDSGQVEADLWCTNRDLPLSMPIGQDSSDFTLADGAPVTAIRCITGPTPPMPMLADGTQDWPLLNLLTLNYLSLASDDAVAGLAALKRLMSAFCQPSDHASRLLIDRLTGLDSRMVTRRLPVAGPISFGQGLAITLTIDDLGLEDGQAFLLASLLQRFFQQFINLNHFIELRAHSPLRGCFAHWDVREGLWPPL